VLDDLLAAGASPNSPTTKDFLMTNKSEPEDAKKDTNERLPIIHLGMIGDGTEEKNLGERSKMDAAFNQPAPKKKP
jgi:hypothetical protein